MVEGLPLRLDRSGLEVKASLDRAVTPVLSERWWEEGPREEVDSRCAREMEGGEEAVVEEVDPAKEGEDRDAVSDSVEEVDDRRTEEGGWL